MLECKNITQRFQSNNALSDVSLTLNKGVYGLIGENGAGKSTLFKLLMGLIPLQKGSITIDGTTPEKEKLRMGYLPQNFDFFHKLTVYESLEYVGTMKGLSKNVLSEEIYDWLGRVNLLAEKEKKTGALSGGMKQRLGIAQAFLGAPRYVLLDEPTVGLDPKERVAFRNMVNEVGADRVILISTHIIDDVQAACENILVLHKGRLLYEGTTQDFINSVRDGIFTIRIPRRRLSEFSPILDIISIKLLGEELEIRFVDREYSIELPGKTEECCTLEDAYFLTTGMFYKKGAAARYDKSIFESQV